MLKTLNILIPKTIAVPAQKDLGRTMKFCPNYDFIVHFGYDKKIV